MILIYGKGGHGKVVADTIQVCGEKQDVDFFDDCNRIYDEKYSTNASLIIAIGDGEVRKRLSTVIQHSYATIIHPTAYVSKSAFIGEGTVVLANAVVQAGARIGKHCIINANVTIDHDAILEDFVTTYPSSYVGGFGHVLEGRTLKPGQVIWKGEVY